jgi:hypothetical protein
MKHTIYPLRSEQKNNNNINIFSNNPHSIRFLFKKLLFTPTSLLKKNIKGNCWRKKHNVFSVECIPSFPSEILCFFSNITQIGLVDDGFKKKFVTNHRTILHRIFLLANKIKNNSPSICILSLFTGSFFVPSSTTLCQNFKYNEPKGFTKSFTKNETFGNMSEVVF